MAHADRLRNVCSQLVESLCVVEVVVVVAVAVAVAVAAVVAAVVVVVVISTPETLVPDFLGTTGQ